MYNKQRSNHDRQENKTRVLTWRRETRRDPGEGSQILTGSNPGNTGSSPRVHHTGPEVHRDRVSRNFEPGNKRFFSRRLELVQLAPSRGPATSHYDEVTSNKRQAASFKQQASSGELQAFKIIVDQI